MLTRKRGRNPFGKTSGRRDDRFFLGSAQKRSMRERLEIRHRTLPNNTRRYKGIHTFSAERARMAFCPASAAVNGSMFLWTRNKAHNHKNYVNFTSASPQPFLHSEQTGTPQTTMYRAGQFCVQRRFVLVWKNGGRVSLGTYYAFWKNDDSPDWFSLQRPFRDQRFKSMMRIPALRFLSMPGMSFSSYCYPLLFFLR
uniref:hypothetical protein n=1 Tax=uncultured Bilophila sp. TaxID=529385 RepID=UPI0025D05764|nr:hypothetical protein [uncultured Bilophila sp.]